MQPPLALPAASARSSATSGRRSSSFSVASGAGGAPPVLTVSPSAPRAHSIDEWIGGEAEDSDGCDRALKMTRSNFKQSNACCAVTTCALGDAMGRFVRGCYVQVLHQKSTTIYEYAVTFWVNRHGPAREHRKASLFLIRRGGPLYILMLIYCKASQGVSS